MLLGTFNLVLQKNVFLEGVFFYMCVYFLDNWLDLPYMFFQNLVRSFASFKQYWPLFFAERMKCGSFGSFSGSGKSAIFLLTDWFISQESELRFQIFFSDLHLQKLSISI